MFKCKIKLRQMRDPRKQIWVTKSDYSRRRSKLVQMTLTKPKERRKILLNWYFVGNIESLRSL
ncbi:MAG: hypothetical protein AB8E15_01535 [Bdellovibrionales bacterium]